MIESERVMQLNNLWIKKESNTAETSTKLISDIGRDHRSVSNPRSLTGCWSSRGKESRRILIRSIASLMRTNLNSSTPWLELWTHTIPECQRLEASRSRRKINILTSSLLRREVSSEPQMLTLVLTLRELLKERLLTQIDLRGKDQDLLSSRATITSTRRAALTLTIRVELRFL